MSDVSDRLLNTIEYRNVSYGELSKKTGIPKSALQRYATGETEKIPLDRLEKIAKALGVNAAYLLGWENLPFIEVDFPKQLTEWQNSDEVQTIVKQSQARMQKAKDWARVFADFYYDLNETGRDEAVKRVEELTYLPDYCAEDLKQEKPSEEG